jgi:hypothetical protein
MQFLDRYELAAVLLLAATAPVAFAGESKVSLSGAEEVPAVTTSATGTGSISVSADKQVTGSVKTSGIEGTVAHIHVGAIGKNGPPAITLSKNADGTWSVPANSTLTDEQFAKYQAGELYVNVHSAAHKTGEIRGQVKP